MIMAKTVIKNFSAKKTSASMTSRERVLTAMRRQTPDRVPFAIPGFVAAKRTEFEQRTGHKNPAEYFGMDVRAARINPIRDLPDYSKYHPDKPSQLKIDQWGVGHLPAANCDSQYAHLSQFVYPMRNLKSIGELMEYPFPDLDAAYRFEGVDRQIAQIQQAGFAATLGSLSIFEVAWQLRSMELLLMDFIDNPEFAAALLDRITVTSEKCVQRMAELKPDIIILGDDVACQRGMIMSVPMWRKWLKPCLARLVKAGKRIYPDVLIFYHSDGDVTTIVADLIEIGVDILNPVQPECMDPAEMKKKYGDRLSFWGTIGTQTTLPFGTVEDVRQEVRTRMETVGRGGGLLLAPSHVIEPEVPWENIVAFVEAVRELGVYP